jgi:tartrate-resistant acid phosphatase type 5
MLASLAFTRCPTAPSAVGKALVDAFTAATDARVSLIGDSCDPVVAPLSEGELLVAAWRRFLSGLRFAASRSFSVRLPPSARLVADAFVDAAVDDSTATDAAAALRDLCNELGTTPYTDASSAASAVEQAMIAVQGSIGEPLASLTAPLLAQYAREVVAAPPATPGLEPSYSWRDGLRSALAVPSPRGVAWVAFGDWGEDYCTTELGNRVAAFLEKTQAPPLDFMLLLGDNFYPNGAASVEDKRFNTMWADAFLGHQRLRVPHKVVMGNHDMRYGNGPHQVRYTDSVRNHGGLWQYGNADRDPTADATKCYAFRACAAPPVQTVLAGGSAVSEGVPVCFHVIDTCAAQWNCRRDDPTIVGAFHTEKALLAGALAEEARALPPHRWTFVCGHHGMYTNGFGHHDEGLCLRSEKYTVKSRWGEEAAMDGLGLEAVLVNHGVDAYYCGHDHVLQTIRRDGVDHFGVGAAVECGYYQGPHPQPAVTVPWHYDRHRGFAYNRVVVNTDGSSTFTMQFVNSRDGSILHSIQRHKDSDGCLRPVADDAATRREWSPAPPNVSPQRATRGGDTPPPQF